VRGPGLVVTVGDGPPPKDPVTGEPTGEPDLGRVQDRDLQELVNALWRAGAEGVAVDRQRLTPTSTIRLAGEAVLVDLRPVTSPYTIEAVGSPAGFDSRFVTSAVAKRFRTYIQRYGMRFELAHSDGLSLPAATSSPLNYARAPSLSPSPSGGTAPPSRTGPPRGPLTPATGGGR
jgi:uncharacterized protein YlxW (UPF0749 family)